MSDVTLTGTPYINLILQLKQITEIINKEFYDLNYHFLASHLRLLKQVVFRATWKRNVFQKQNK